jgi:hypothetical protein
MCKEYLIMKNFCLHSQQHAYPASRKISALGELFIYLPMNKVPYTKSALSYADQILHITLIATHLNIDFHTMGLPIDWKTETF